MPSNTARIRELEQTAKTDRDQALESASRVIAELRRGAPVVVSASGPGENRPAWAAVAAEYASDAVLAQARTWGQGPALLALTGRRAAVLHIPPSGDAVILLRIGDDMTAGTVLSLADPTTDLGHPLRGPFERAHEPVDDGLQTVINLCKAAYLLPAAIVARLEVGISAPDWAAARGMAEVSTRRFEILREAQSSELHQLVSAPVPLAGAEDTRLVVFRPAGGGKEHVAIVIGSPAADQPALVRLHSECFTGDLLASLRCDCGEQLRGAVSVIAEAGGGALLYLAQEGRDIGLVNKLRAYRLQDEGHDTVEANQRLGFEDDERLFAAAAEMLRQCGFSKIRLLTNNPRKVEALTRLGIEVTERVPHSFPPNNHNQDYLATKARRSGHYLDTGDD